MRHYAGGSLNGSLFSSGASLTGLGDWTDYLPDWGTSTSDQPATSTPANMKTCPDGSVVSMLTPCPDSGTPEAHSPGAVPNIDGCNADFGYQVDPLNSKYCILTKAAQTASASCKYDEYYDTFTKKCVKNPELVPAKGETPCPAGTYKPFGSSTCIKTPAPKPTGGGGVVKTTPVTPATPPTPPVEAGMFGLSPMTIGIGLVVAVGGALAYRRYKKKHGGLKKNWHDEDEYDADDMAWE